MNRCYSNGHEQQPNPGPREIRQYQTRIRNSFNDVIKIMASDANRPEGLDQRQAFASIAVELIYLAGSIFGAAANCRDGHAALAPIDRVLREYQKLADENDGYHFRIIDIRG